jgi:signal transduction histidine kinase
VLDAVERRYLTVELDRRLDPADLEVHADPARLEQALANIVDNALRHGGGPVRLGARERGGRVEFHVVDRGPGFPPEFLPRAFERFARADAGRSSDGTGLGLAIIDAVARAHGGSAHVANGVRGGADVWIAIPIPSARTGGNPSSRGEEGG